MSEKIDKDDLRENGHREGVKLIVGDYLKSFEMFDFSKLHYSRSNCTLNNLQRKRSNSRWKTKKNFKWVKIGFSDVGGLKLVTVFECWWQNLDHGKIEEILMRPLCWQTGNIGHQNGSGTNRCQHHHACDKHLVRTGRMSREINCTFNFSVK